jgi:hypothetical protein
MAKSPAGSRPVPAVPTGKRPSFPTKTMGAYSGVRGSKSPSGSRPTPAVAKNSPNFNAKTNKVRQAPKHISMPTPKNKAAHHLKGKGAGGA